MIGILVAKLKQFVRSPWTFIIFTAMSIAMALIFGGFSGDERANVPIYASQNVIEHTSMKEALNKENAFQFNWVSEKELRKKIATGKAELGVILHQDDYEIVVGVDSFNKSLVEQTIQSAYSNNNLEENILNAVSITSATEKKDFLDTMREEINTPVFQMTVNSFKGEGAFVYNSRLHSLFGFSLFFVIYTIAYNVLPILLEKRDGIWDRVIMSPVKKWEMYVANLIYSFVTGYMQVVITFLVFRYVVGIDFNGRFLESLLLLIPYVFAIVAMAMLLTGLVKRVQQFNAFLPIVSVSMAMIGGAYWPIEIVSSNVLKYLSKIDPITYGMEILNGLTVYGYSFETLLLPISILVLMGVVMMGIGIHLVEKRHV